MSIDFSQKPRTLIYHILTPQTLTYIFAKTMQKLTLVTIFYFFLLPAFSQELSLKQTLEETTSASALEKNFILVLKNNQTNEFTQAADDYLSERTEKDLRLYKKLSMISDQADFLELTDKITNNQFRLWLAHPERRRELLYNLTRKDKTAVVLKDLEQLYNHDNKELYKYYRLGLALTLVWDQKRPPIHHQMGRKTLPYQKELLQRYDYFKKLYKGRSKISYKSLTVQHLIFVVDTPVPVSELEWALNNERGSIREWQKKYAAIIYNQPRLKKAQYSWIDGNYALANIKEKGGICVDQAYYTVITARAFGIPAMFFTGEGRNAGEMHAWAGYMLSPKKWNLDVGRYATMKFVFGNAYDPQTNQAMSDHLLAFKCHPDLQKKSFLDCKSLTRLAQRYNKLNMGKLSFLLADKACNTEKLYLKPWQLIEDYYINTKQKNKLPHHYRNKITAFKKYPDFVYQIGQKAITTLEKQGMQRDADYIQKIISKNVRDREDLKEAAIRKQVNELYAEGKFEEGRKTFEAYLKKQKGMYNDIHDDLTLYLELTSQSDQTKKAVSFIKRFIKKDKQREEVCLKYLREAYINDGDQKRADKL